MQELITKRFQLIRKLKLFKYACKCNEQLGCIFSFSLIFYLPKLELCSNTYELCKWYTIIKAFKSLSHFKEYKT